MQASDGGSGLASVTLRAGGVPPTTDPSATFDTPVASAVIHGEEDATRSPDGPLAFTATARDAAGNEASVLVTVQVDNTAPKKTLLSPVDASTVSGVIAIAVEILDEPNLVSIEIFVDGISQGTSSVAPFSVLFDTTSRLDGAMAVRVVATDLAGNSSACTANVTVDNISVVLHPETLTLKSKSKDHSVTALLEGVNVGLLMPTESKAIFLCVPGGNPIPSSAGFAGDDEASDEDDDDDGIPKLVIKFDRQQLIASIRAGISAGQFAPNSNVTVTLKAGEGFVIGTDVIRVNGQ